jgi:3-hydroxyacyl-[acyl-carrier-protein] dehydratase
MLLGDFFKIVSIQKEENSHKLVLELNASHKIFEGHFPGQPVVPGACLLQMVKEMMQTLIGANLQLVKANQLKFLAPIDPRKQNILQAEIGYYMVENSLLTVSATILQDEVVCCKCSGMFRTNNSMYKI